MILLYVLPSLLAFCYGQNAALSITCGDTEDSLTFTAVYSGLGTPGSVIWTYSGASLTVDTSGCSVFGTVPAVFPAKMSFKCGNIDASLPTDTYQLTVSSLNNTDYGKTWAVTFTPPTGAAPPPVPSVAPSDCSTCKCKCKCICRPHQIGGISTGVLGPLILPVAVGGRLQGCFSQTVGLAVNGIGFVLDIVSLGLSSSVQADNCCEECKEGEDCCNEQDCCEDEECCDDEKCCPSWIMGCSIAFIVISCVFAIVAIVIAVLLFKNRIGPLENGNNFCCENNDGDGYDGHDDGNAHRKPRVHSDMEERHRETLSNRPMPPIPPQDRKGRGLSANYDDNHPMISVGIPDKKAGQLEPMEEEPRKKKKKKKKNVNEEDN